MGRGERGRRRLRRGKGEREESEGREKGEREGRERREREKGERTGREKREKAERETGNGEGGGTWSIRSKNAGKMGKVNIRKAAIQQLQGGGGRTGNS
jgi:hypothetical protein